MNSVITKELFLRKGKEILGQKTKDITTDAFVQKALDLFVPGRTGNYSSFTLQRFERKILRLPEHQNILRISQLATAEISKICTYQGFEKHINETSTKFINYLLIEIDKLLDIHQKYSILFEDETNFIIKIKNILDELYFNHSKILLGQKVVELKNIHLAMDKDGFSFDAASNIIIWTLTHYYQKIKINIFLKRKIGRIANEIFRYSQGLSTSPKNFLQTPSFAQKAVAA